MPYTYRRASERDREAYHIWLREGEIDSTEYPFEKLYRDPDTGNITHCYRFVRFQDLSRTMLGWAAWVIVYRDMATKQEEPLIVEYSVHGKIKKPLNCFVPSKNRR